MHKQANKTPVLKMKISNKIILSIILILIFGNLNFSQELNEANKSYLSKPELNYSLIKDTTNVTNPDKVSISGIFISPGFGLSIPLAEFHNKSNPVFGIFGRVEYASTSIFPFVFGGEISYFSYTGQDNYLTQNYLTTYQTKILSYGLTSDISLAWLFKVAYTIPFIALDVKSNSIKRQIAGTSTLPNDPLQQSKISIGAGAGFTIFIFDFFVKYNYMKDLSSFGAFTKIKFRLHLF